MAQLSIFDTVGASLRLVREQIRAIVMIAAIGSAAVTIVSVAGASVGGIAPIVFSVLSTFFSAAIYAALLQLVLRAEPERRSRLLSDTRLVWTTMLVVLFFLFIVGVLFFMVSLMMAGPVVAPFATQISAAGNDDAARMAVAQQILERNPGFILFLFAFAAVVWMFVTSRLYLAAPASLASGRVLTFDTWRWTNGNVLRIIGARFLLLLPAYVLYDALGALAARAVGVDVAQGDPLAVMRAMQALVQSNVALYALFSFVTQFMVVFYTAFEAALSSYLYLALKPQTAIPTA